MEHESFEAPLETVETVPEAVPLEARDAPVETVVLPQAAEPLPPEPVDATPETAVLADASSDEPEVDLPPPERVDTIPEPAVLADAGIDEPIAELPPPEPSAPDVPSVLPEAAAPPVDFETVREALLSNVDNEQLNNHADQLYREGVTYGDGGTATVLIHKKEAGELLGGKPHGGKAENRRNGLDNLLNDAGLFPTDRAIAEELKEYLDIAIAYELVAKLPPHQTSVTVPEPGAAEGPLGDIPPSEVQQPETESFTLGPVPLEARFTQPQVPERVTVDFGELPPPEGQTLDTRLADRQFQGQLDRGGEVSDRVEKLNQVTDAMENAIEQLSSLGTSDQQPWMARPELALDPATAAIAALGAGASLMRRKP